VQSPLFPFRGVLAFLLSVPRGEGSPAYTTSALVFSLCDHTIAGPALGDLNVPIASANLYFVSQHVFDLTIFVWSIPLYSAAPISSLGAIH
jgi:hypothetical protein